MDLFKYDKSFPVNASLSNELDNHKSALLEGNNTSWNKQKC